MTRQLLVGLACTALLLVAPPSSADPITITFDGLGDLDSVTNQYAGLTFSNTIALQGVLPASLRDLT
jgi:hypothetical protein